MRAGTPKLIAGIALMGLWVVHDTLTLSAAPPIPALLPGSPAFRRPVSPFPPRPDAHRTVPSRPYAPPAAEQTAAERRDSLPALLWRNLFTSLLRQEKPQPRLPRVLGTPRQGRAGLRYRMNFLEARGLSRMGPTGLTGFVPSRRFDEPRFQTPPAFWGTYALYTTKDPIPVELEIENAGSAPLESLRFSAVIESFDPEKAGRFQALLTFDEPGALRLEPGERRVLRGVALQERPSEDYVVSLSQIHLTAWEEPTGQRLADDPHAAIFDPPAE